MHIKPTIFRVKNIYMTVFTPLQRNLQTAINFMKPSKYEFLPKKLFAMTPNIVGPVSVLCGWDGVENVVSAIHIVIGVLTVQPTDDVSELAN